MGSTGGSYDVVQQRSCKPLRPPGDPDEVVQQRSCGSTRRPETQIRIKMDGKTHQMGRMFKEDLSDTLSGQTIAVIVIEKAPDFVKLRDRSQVFPIVFGLGRRRGLSRRTGGGGH